MSFYDEHNSRLINSSNPANISSKYTLNPGTQALAVRCTNLHSKPWIIGSVSNGLVTNTRWKCFSLPKEVTMKSPLSWAIPNFDDSHWAQAIANVSNREDSPWGKVPVISDRAFWISTADEDHSSLFCRRRFSEMSLDRTRSNGMSSNSTVTKTCSLKY